jgi:hypothetical protein
MFREPPASAGACRCWARRGTDLIDDFAAHRLTVRRFERYRMARGHFAYICVRGSRARLNKRELTTRPGIADLSMEEMFDLPRVAFMRNRHKHIKPLGSPLRGLAFGARR